MKKIILLLACIATGLSLSAQKGDKAAIGSLGYQTDYKRFAIGVQGRYNICLLYTSISLVCLV